MGISGLESTGTKLCDVGQSRPLPRGEVLTFPPPHASPWEVSKVAHTHSLHPHRRSKASERCTTYGLSACVLRPGIQRRGPCCPRADGTLPGAKCMALWSRYVRDKGQKSLLRLPEPPTGSTPSVLQAFTLCLHCGPWGRRGCYYPHSADAETEAQGGASLPPGHVTMSSGPRAWTLTPSTKVPVPDRDTLPAMTLPLRPAPACGCGHHQGLCRDWLFWRGRLYQRQGHEPWRAQPAVTASVGLTDSRQVPPHPQIGPFYRKRACSPSKQMVLSTQNTQVAALGPPVSVSCMFLG